MDRKNFELIASGSNSQIYKYSAKKAVFALKVVPVSCLKEVGHLANEAKVLEALDHDYVIKAVKYQENYDFHGKKQNSYIKDERNIMVMQYATKGSFLNYLKAHRPSLLQIKLLFKKICQGLKHIHSKGYSHRDLKLDNILIFQDGANCYPKLSDFGFASYCYKNGEKIRFKQFRGTKKGYMAPQIHQLLTDPTASYDAMKTDIFSLGVIWFALVLGCLPFQYANPQNKLYALISQKKIEQFWQVHRKSLQKVGLIEGNSSTQLFKDLFIRMVDPSPEQRPNICQILEDTWFEETQ